MPKTLKSKPAKAPSDAARNTASDGYTVLARRYRSRDFDELIGQEPIARTLQNAIAAGRTAHAYLFCGTRGVGKTSTARLFAKALNVTPDLTEADAIANAILRGEDLDVIEIDAASNRGIDNARDLIANAGIAPARCRYKIYIIDEVHALTKDAFNALLKIMEEPPSHVKFILCTTEAHKVPATIQSRCQRFDFRPIPTHRIADQIRMILEREGISAEEDVVMQVARLGHGSMRDALSLLDRLLAAGEEKLTSDLLERMVGLPDYTLVSELVDAIVAGDAGAALKKGDELLMRGTSFEQGLELLAEHFRTLMVICACGARSQLLELSTEAAKAAEAQAQHFDAAALVHSIAICDAVARSASVSTAGRALFDAAIVRLTMSERFADVNALLRGGHTPEIKTLPVGKKKEVRTPQSAAADTGLPLREARTPTPVLNELKPSQSDELDGPSIWSRVQEVLANEPVGVQTRIGHLVYESIDGGTITLGIDEAGSSMARILVQQAEQVAELIRRATGRTMRVQINPPGGELPSNSVPAPSDFDDVHSLPAVRQAIDTFDATVVGVERVDVP